MRTESGKRKMGRGLGRTGRVWLGRSGCRSSFAPCHSAAFTLVELLAVVALIGLMTMVGIQGLGSSKGSSLISAARQFSNDLTLARQYALARNCRVRVVVATEKTIKDSGTDLPELIGMQYRAYAVMIQLRIYGSWWGRLANQPDLPYGRRRWEYLESWKTLPKRVIFDPADSDLKSADGKNLSLPRTTIFFGDAATRNLWDGITLDRLPFPYRNSDSDPPNGSEMAFVEFKPNGMPTMAGSVRLVNGLVQVSPSGDNATILVPGRESARSASSVNDPASVNSVVLSWDGFVGKIKWTQPGR